jgi:hypothetical protein
MLSRRSKHERRSVPVRTIKLLKKEYMANEIENLNAVSENSENPIARMMAGRTDQV